MQVFYQSVNVVDTGFSSTLVWEGGSYRHGQLSTHVSEVMGTHSLLLSLPAQGH